MPRPWLLAGTAPGNHGKPGCHIISGAIGQSDLSGKRDIHTWVAGVPVWGGVMLRNLERIKILKWFLKSATSRQRRRSPNTRPVPLTRRFLLGLRGFFPEKHAFYRFDIHDRRLYINDIQMLRSSLINRRYRTILDNKLLFEKIVGRYATVPESFVLIRDAKPFWLGASAEKRCTLPDLVREKRVVIAKPVFGSGGNGIQLLQFRDGCFRRNGAQIDPSDLSWKSLGAGDMLVSEYIHQGSFAAGLYSGSVNTIRMLTMQDPDTQLPFFAGAIMRIGCDRSAPVDNVSRGGLFCNIEPESGKLSKAVAGFHLDGPARRIEHHPDSGVRFEEQVIPHWHNILEQTVALAVKLPMLPYIAWDLAILDHGIVVIEANSWSELASIQMGRPLLADPRVRRFLEHHDVL